jgi:hypothetical protein
LSDWAISEKGVVDQSTGFMHSTEKYARFKHCHEVNAGDVWSMTVEHGRGVIGFCGEEYNVHKHKETSSTTVWVHLGSGTTYTNVDMSLDLKTTSQPDFLQDLIPETSPYTVALRCDRDGNVPQIQFQEDGVWHDFAPERAAVRAGPWYVFMDLYQGDYMHDHIVQKPKTEQQIKTDLRQEEKRHGQGPDAHDGSGKKAAEKPEGP